MKKSAALAVGVDRIATDVSLEEQLEDRTEECEVLKARLEESKTKFLTLAAKKFRTGSSIIGLWGSTLSLVGGIAFATGQSIFLSTFIANAILGITYFVIALILSLKKPTP